MSIFGRIRSSIGGAVSLADPRRLARAVDVRPLASGRWPGTSLFAAGGALATGGLHLKDRWRLHAGNPRTIAKAVAITGMASQSSRWAPRGFAGFGPMVANIASLRRAKLPSAAIQRVRLARWW